MVNADIQNNATINNNKLNFFYTQLNEPTIQNLIKILKVVGSPNKKTLLLNFRD